METTNQKNIVCEEENYLPTFIPYLHESRAVKRKLSTLTKRLTVHIRFINSKLITDVNILLLMKWQIVRFVGSLW